MSGLFALSPAKWIPTVLQISISITSAVVFFVLDFLEIIMCIFFRFFDGPLDGESSPCHRMKRPGMVQENNDDFLELERDKELSESLHGRRNLFRETGLNRNPRAPSKKQGLCVGELKNRWSDCGCESCVSWMSNGSSDFRLHVIVKQSPKASQELCSQESSVQNVTLIHGFLLSSSFRIAYVFPNLSEHTSTEFLRWTCYDLGVVQSQKNYSYTLTEHLEMVEGCVIHQYRLSSFHFVAHSMGCVIALALAAKHSKSVKSITLPVDPPGLMDLNFSIIDMTCHTHHSAWHTMHNVIRGGAKLLDGYFEVLTDARVKIHAVQSTRDRIVPIECSFNMKAKATHAELEIVPNADHNSVFFGRKKEFIRSLECLWASTNWRG